jgi:hypothetical protein
MGGAKLINGADQMVHVPERGTQEAIDRGGRGVEHLADEFGMLWARTKQKVIGL